MADNLTIPSSRVEFIDPRTGTISREWFLFLLKLLGTSTSVSDDALVGPDVGALSDQITELRKQIQDVALGIPNLVVEDQATIDLGYLNVTDFGVNGTATDAANMATAIAAAITQKRKLYAPQMTINMGTTTLVFPETVPLGFTFECDPGCIIAYTGTGDAVSINSAGFCSFKFGGFFGAGGANGIHINPTLPNINFSSQTAVVACEIEFNTIMGFYCGVHADNGIGNVAQNNVKGLAIITGQGGNAPASMGGTTYGIRASGRVGGVYQGNMWNVNYIECDPAYFAPGAVWVGIEDGDATMGDTNNVNTYQYGAIDAITYPLSYGINSYGNRNIFIGDIVDIHICFQVASTGYFLYILAGALSTFGVPGDYQVFDNSAIAGAWHWTWIGASDGRTTNLVTGTPLPKGPAWMVATPTSYPALSGAITAIPVAAVGSGGTGLSISAGGIQVAVAGYYTIKGGCFITAPGPSLLEVGVGTAATVMAMNTTNATTAGMCAACDAYLNAGDVVYLGAVSTAGGNPTAGPINFLSVTGPLQ